MLTRRLQAEGVRRELASRRGDEIRHREQVARFQKTIEGIREVLAAESASAAVETNRRDGRVEKLQKGPSPPRPDAGTGNSQRQQLLAEIERTLQRIKPETRNQTTKRTPDQGEMLPCYSNNIT